MSNKSEASREDVGVVFDEIKFSQVFTAADVRLILKGAYKNWDDDLYRQYIDQFKLPMNKKIKEFSRGMKMKLSLAAALAHHPKLLILDEATSGIDPVVRDEILDLFLEFIQDEQHTILASSHIISDLEKAADYVTFINIRRGAAHAHGQGAGGLCLGKGGHRGHHAYDDQKRSVKKGENI